MKIDYSSVNDTKPAWKIGDVIHNVNGGFYLVAKVGDRDFDVTEAYSYALIDLETGDSSASYETIRELQRNLYDDGDMILAGTFKYEDAK